MAVAAQQAELAQASRWAALAAASGYTELPIAIPVSAPGAVRPAILGNREDL